MGDLRNALKKIQTATRLIKLTPSIDVKEIGEGSVKEYLRVYHYLFLDYNPQIAADIVNKHNIELSYLNDKSFVDGVYRLCRDMLTYAPRLTKDQFFHAGFAQAKAEMAAEIIDRVRGLVALMAVNNGLASSNSTRIRAESNERESKTTNRATNLSPPVPVSCRASVSATSLVRQPSTKGTPKKPSAPTRYNNPLRASRAVVSKDAESTQAEENEAMKRAAAADSLLMVGLVEKINEMHAKMEQLSLVVQRVDQMDQRLANVEKMMTEARRVEPSNPPGPSPAQEIGKLNKTCEAITNKMTLLETELLVIKQGLSQQQSKATRLSYDPNDSTTYETPHQSFMLMSPGARNGADNGEDLSESHDLTLNGTDLTPTLMSESGDGARSNINGGDLNRAKELIKRASLFSSSLATPNLVS